MSHYSKYISTTDKYDWHYTVCCLCFLSNNSSEIWNQHDSHRHQIWHTAAERHCCFLNYSEFLLQLRGPYLLRQDVPANKRPSPLLPSPPRTGREWISCQQWSLPLLKSTIISHNQLSCIPIHFINAYDRFFISNFQKHAVCLPLVGHDLPKTESCPQNQPIATEHRPGMCMRVCVICQEDIPTHSSTLSGSDQECLGPHTHTHMVTHTLGKVYLVSSCVGPTARPSWAGKSLRSVSLGEENRHWLDYKMLTHPVVSILTLSLTIGRRRRHREGRSRRDEVCVSPMVHTVSFVEMLLKKTTEWNKGNSQHVFNKFYFMVNNPTHTPADISLVICVWLKAHVLV